MNKFSETVNMNLIVSIVVPVYNVEKYLRRCVDSLIRQTYKNVEIILVDDGSTDGCTKICDDYAKLDNRIKVLHKKNGGLSDARNAGLTVASGDYVSFVDSDDWVHEDFIKILVNMTEETGADISVCSYKKIYSDSNVSNENKCVAELCKPILFNPVEAIRDIFSADTKLWITTWNKLYKKSLFTKNKIVFPVGKIHEDNFTTYKLFFYAERIAFIDVPLYYYFQRTDSIMGRPFDTRRLVIFEALKETERFIVDNNLLVKNEFENYKYLNMLTILDALLCSDMNKTEKSTLIKNIKNDINSNMKNILDNRAIASRHKLMLLTMSFNDSLYMCAKKYAKKLARR